MQNRAVDLSLAQMLLSMRMVGEGCAKLSKATPQIDYVNLNVVSNKNQNNECWLAEDTERDYPASKYNNGLCLQSPCFFA